MSREPRTFRATIPIPPRTKQGVRFGPSGKPYQDQKILAYEQAVAAAWEETGHPMLTVPVKVRVRLYKDRTEVWITEILGQDQKLKKAPTGDLDNYCKALFDGLEGHAFGNDKQIREMRVSKHGVDE